MPIRIEAFESTVDGLIKEFSEEEQKKIDEITKTTAKECKELVKQNGSGQSGRAKKSIPWDEYLAGWAVKSERKGTHRGYKIHNKTKPGLTHLLEFGHAIKNQYGEYSGASGKYPHVEPAEEKTKEEYMRKLKEEL